MTYMVTLLYDISNYPLYEEYGIEARKIVELFGGRFIIASYKAFEIKAIEGNTADVVNVAVFKDQESYYAFYNSAEYQELIPLRNKICKSQIIMLEKEIL